MTTTEEQQSTTEQTPTTTDATPKPTVHEVWAQHHFEGKEFCQINDSGEIVLLAAVGSPERVLATLTPENMVSVTQALADKFKEVVSKVYELDQEWQQTEDKLKLNGKVIRLKDYLLRANAIGNYADLHQIVASMSNAIQEIQELNYNEKLKIVEAAEALKSSEDWKVTTEAFKEIVERWKNVNPADKGRNDQLWERIEAARNFFYDRKRQHQEGLQQDMMQNLDLKLELCELAEQQAQSEDWRKTSDILKELMDKWKTIGRVASPEKNEELWTRFVTARNIFFDRKKLHFDQIQQEQEANYLLKLALVEKAESLVSSTEWKETTLVHNTIMDQWKTIGKVPFDKSDELWNRLQAARDQFFSAKRQSAEEFKVNLEDNYAQKQALLNRALELKNSSQWKEATEELNELMTEWKKIGTVPREYGDQLWEDFIAARHYFFKRKDEDRDKRRARFHNQLDTRIQQTQQFLEKITEELNDEESKLVEFRNSLQNTTDTGTAKELELKRHLEQLIQQIERKLPTRKAKIEEVQQQYDELKAKREEMNAPKEA
jgi:hypothetical protein